MTTFLAWWIGGVTWMCGTLVCLAAGWFLL